MADIARLVVEIDSNGAVLAVKNLDALTAAGKKSEDQAKKTKTNWTELNQALEVARKGFEIVSGVVESSIDKFVEAEASGVKLEAILRATGQSAGKTADDLAAMAQRLSGVTVFDDDSITNAEAMLLTFKDIRGEIYDETVPAVLDLASAFGMDLASASVMLGKALEDPVEGLTALRRVGVSFTDSEQDQIKAMYDAGQTAEAQSKILKTLEGQVGGVAEAMGDSAGGQIEKFKNAIEDLQEAIGRLVATDFSPLIANLTSTLNLLNGKNADVFWTPLLATGNSANGKNLGAGWTAGMINNLSPDQIKHLLEQIDELESRPDNDLTRLYGETIGVLNLQKALLDQQREIAKVIFMGGGNKPSVPAPTVDFPQWQNDAAMRPQDQAALALLVQQRNQQAQDAIDSAQQPEMPGIDVTGDLTGKNYADIANGLKAFSDLGTNGIDAQTVALQQAAKAAIELATSYDAISTAVKSVATPERISSEFQDVGRALQQGADAGQAFKVSLAEMSIDILKTISLLLIQAGVAALAPPPIGGGWLNPVGWALIAEGGGLGILAGAASGALSDVQGGGNTKHRSVNDAIITKDGQVIETHPDDNLYAFKQLPGAEVASAGRVGAVSVQIVNQSGTKVSGAAQASTAPDGTQIIKIVLSAVDEAMANGKYNRSLEANYQGLQRRGVSRS